CLYESYWSLQTFRTREEREALLDDLIRVSLPDEMDEEKFRDEVGRKLLTSPEIFELIAVANGCDLLHRNRMAPYPTALRVRRVQALIRWLLFFLPGRYRLSTPRYSEIFGRSYTWPQGA